MVTGTPLKVSQLNLLAKKILEGNFTSINIEGEVSNLVRPPSGHLYFSLKDEKAQVRAVFFRHQQHGLKFNLRDGIVVIVTATVSLYETRGDYQLVVESIELAGEGVLYTKYLQLKSKLLKLGYFDQCHKKPLPVFPRTIGVITSKSGAVVRDIIIILRRRFPGVAIIIYPTLVQGVDAIPRVVEAIATANLRSECQLLILARGGGSLEDLWVFNTEEVARAIFASSIPIISAIGHESDFTIADLVADCRASTPSAAAEIAMASVKNWWLSLENFWHSLVKSISRELLTAKLLLSRRQMQLRHPGITLGNRYRQLQAMVYRLKTAMEHQLQLYRKRLLKNSVILEMANPYTILERGYGLVMQNNKVITTIGAIIAGEDIHIQLQDGSLIATVKTTILSGPFPHQ